jgi:hypothetical protein
LGGIQSTPTKVIRFFSLIARLKRMYRSPEVAELLKWHTSNIKVGDRMESIVDSPAWEHITNIDSSFIAEKCNVHMGLSLDGVNPHSIKNATYSIWPVLIVFYNLPP